MKKDLQITKTKIDKKIEELSSRRDNINKTIKRQQSDLTVVDKDLGELNTQAKKLEELINK